MELVHQSTHLKEKVTFVQYIEQHTNLSDQKETSLLITFLDFVYLILPSQSGSSSSVWQKVMFRCQMNALESGDNNEKISLPQGNH